MKRFIVSVAKAAVLAGVLTSSVFAQVAFDRSQPGSSVTGNRATSNYQPYVLPSTVCDINNTNCITAATQRPAYVLPSTVCDINNTNCITAATQRPAYVLPNTVCDASNNNCRTFANTQDYVLPSTVCDRNNNNCRTTGNTPENPGLPPDICTASNGYCNQVAPPPSVASGSQCGGVIYSNDRTNSRTSCLGNTLAMGRQAICPSGFSPGTGLPNRLVSVCYENNFDTNCYTGTGDAASGSCPDILTAPALDFYNVPAYLVVEITNTNCPAGYTYTRMFNIGGDQFYSCVKN
jgi:hypothetical protein